MPWSGCWRRSATASTDCSPRWRRRRRSGRGSAGGRRGRDDDDPGQARGSDAGAGRGHGGDSGPAGRPGQAVRRHRRCRGQHRGSADRPRPRTGLRTRRDRRRASTRPIGWSRRWLRAAGPRTGNLLPRDDDSRCEQARGGDGWHRRLRQEQREQGSGVAARACATWTPGRCTGR